MKYEHFSVAISYECSQTLLFSYDFHACKRFPSSTQAAPSAPPSPPPPPPNSCAKEWANMHNMWNKINIPLCLLCVGWFFLVDNCGGGGGDSSSGSRSSNGNEKSFDGKLLCDEYKVAWKELWIYRRTNNALYFYDWTPWGTLCYTRTHSIFGFADHLFFSPFDCFALKWCFRWRRSFSSCFHGHLFSYSMRCSRKHQNVYERVSRNLFVLCINSNGLQ